MKLTLNTKLSELTVKQQRQLVTYMRAWCATHFGINRRSRKPLRIQLLDPGGDDEEWDNQYHGWYDQQGHRLVINIYRSRHIKQFLKTFLHEYTHTTQSIKSRYNIYNKVFGYVDNPYEVHARAYEMYYKHAWKDIRPLLEASINKLVN